MKNYVLKNRLTLLLTTLVVYMFAIAIEGVITQREPSLVEFDNSYFTLDLRDLDELSEIIDAANR